MDGLQTLLNGVEARIVQHEMAVRLGRPHVVELPADGPPLIALAGRAFPDAVLARRMRFLRAVGWVSGPPDDWDPVSAAVLPDTAALEDRLAVLAASRVIRTTDAALGMLAQALGTPVAGVVVPPADHEWWDRRFNELADAIDGSWRARDLAPGGAYARLEAVTVAGDAMFGRRRAGGTWDRLHRAVRRAGDLKRRLW